MYNFLQFLCIIFLTLLTYPKAKMQVIFGNLSAASYRSVIKTLRCCRKAQLLISLMLKLTSLRKNTGVYL